MDSFLLVSQIILAILVVVVILVQTKGTGFGRAWGGGSGTSFTRRGLERLVFRATFVLSALFLFVSILQVVI